MIHSPKSLHESELYYTDPDKGVSCKHFDIDEDEPEPDYHSENAEVYSQLDSLDDQRIINESEIIHTYEELIQHEVKS